MTDIWTDCHSFKVSRNINCIDCITWHSFNEAPYLPNAHYCHTRFKDVRSSISSKCTKSKQWWNLESSFKTNLQMSRQLILFSIDPFLNQNNVGTWSLVLRLLVKNVQTIDPFCLFVIVHWRFVVFK